MIPGARIVRAMFAGAPTPRWLAFPIMPGTVPNISG